MCHDKTMADKKTLELQIQVIADAASKTVKTLSSDFKTLATQVKGIDTASVSSTFKNLQGEITRAANSIKLFGSSSGEIKTMQARIKSATLDLIDGGFKPESKEIQNLISEYKKLDAAGADLESSTGSLAGGFGNLIDQVKALAPAVAAVSFDKQLGAAAGFALEQSDNFRAMREEFGIMLGDMEAGRGLFNELQEFNFWTPFDMEQTSQATKVLMAAKVPLSEITDYLTRFGDISQGNGQKFQSFINAFSKASAKGSADMEVLNVYLDQGIQILDELGKQLGVTSGEVIKMASNGQISFQQFDQALKSLAAEGGLYYGSMETASQRLDAAQAGLQESTNALAASFGDMLAPAALAVVSGITKLVDAINSSPIVKGALAGIIAGIAVAINAQLVKAVVALTVNMWSAYAATMSQAGALSILNPALLAAVAAAGLATATVVTFAARQQDAADAAADTTLALQKQKQGFEELKKSAREYMSFMDDMTIDEAQKTVDSYRNIVIPAAEQALKEAQQKLAATPQKLTETRQTRAGGTMQTYTVQTDNPAYQQALAAVQAAQAELEVYQERLKNAQQITQEISEAKFSADLENANKILERRNELYKNTSEYQREQIQANLDFARSLLTLQTLNPDGTYSGFDKSKTAAIIRDLEEQLADFDQNVASAIGNEWSKKIMSESEKLKAEFDAAQKSLTATAKAYYGDTYNTQADYIRENAAMEQYYQEKITEAERKALTSLHEKQMTAIKEEAQYRMEVARQQLNTGDLSAITGFAGNAAITATADTEAGTLVSSFSAGGIGGVLSQLIEAFIQFFTQIESVNKVLNFASTIMESLFAVIEPIIDSAIKPFAGFLDEIGRTAGMILAPAFNLLALAISPVSAALKILSPVLQAVAKVFEWLNNYVIVPIGNAFIDVINAVIGLLNKIPFVNINKLDRLNVIGEKAEEMAENFEKQSYLIEQKFERQKSAVEEMLQSQLDALTSQYELGLISREEYESEAQKYQSAADEKMYEINKQQKEVLDMINDNTYNMLSEDAKKAVESERTSYAQKWGEKVPVLGHLAGAAVDVGKTIVDGVVAAGKAVGGFFKKLFTWSWDVGTPNIPFDHLAMVHQGETIIPRTFAEGIRSGELSLVGGKGSASSGQPVYISISVAGSVVTENELIDIIYNGIARGIRSGAKNPLPQGA